MMIMTTLDDVDIMVLSFGSSIDDIGNYWR
mgnify:CR=1 FL=1